MLMADDRPAECTCPPLQPQARLCPRGNQHRWKGAGQRTREVTSVRQTFVKWSGRVPLIVVILWPGRLLRVSAVWPDWPGRGQARAAWLRACWSAVPEMMVARRGPGARHPGLLALRSASGLGLPA